MSTSAGAKVLPIDRDRYRYKMKDLADATGLVGFELFGVLARAMFEDALARFKAEVLPFETRITSVAFTIVDGLTLTWASLPGKTYNIETVIFLFSLPSLIHLYNPISSRLKRYL